MKEYDYIVVGAGSAGAIVAARLAENPSVSVLLLEAGKKDKSLLFTIPAAMRYIYHMPKFNWNYSTEAEPALNGRVLEQPRGKVLGGSSSINGQLYLRGHPLDFEKWAESGAADWSYADVLPYFKRLETRVDSTSEYQGSTGPIKVSTAGRNHPLTQAFFNVALQAGYSTTEDVNGAKQDGFGLLPKNIANGVRSSTAKCYLKRSKANLTIKTDCHVRRLRLNGNRVTGVLFTESRSDVEVSTKREVVLCAGAYNSPLILMHSGIGPADQLRQHKLSVNLDLPGVGQNLMDHPIVSLQLKCKQPVTLFNHLNNFSKFQGLVQWFVSRKGILANNHFDAAGFIRSRKGVEFPDIQFGLFPIGVAGITADFFQGHAFQIQISHQRPLSRGFVQLASADQFANPKIHLNLLANEDDMTVMKAGLRLALELVQQDAFEPFAGDEMVPGVEVHSDAEIEEWIRANCGSSFHPCGTCKMGVDRMSVVDPECRVRGIANLRVADASIMPIIPSANLNCPTMMIGEKVADLIAGKGPLPKSDLPFFSEPRWQDVQR